MYIFTVEEHNVIGGFGSAVAEVIAETGGAKLIRLGINDVYSTQVGNQKYLRDFYGISAEKIAERIIKECK